MRTYEALYIVSPELGEDDIQTVSKEVEALVANDGGTIVRSEIWGKRRLAFEVKKFTEGVYILLRYTAKPDFQKKLTNYFKLSDPIFRFLVQHYDEHTLRVEAEEQQRKEAELQAGPPSDHGRGGRSDRDDGPPRRFAPRRDEARERPAPRREAAGEKPAPPREAASEKPAPPREAASEKPAPRVEAASEKPAPPSGEAIEEPAGAGAAAPAPDTQATE